MNHYRHMMEQVALSDRKKEEIMEQLETMETKKRRMPKARTLILAAALAVGALLSIAAGLPARVYNFANGDQVRVMPDMTYANVTAGGDTEAAFLSVEDGRLWFEADGWHIDITDKISEETPYIYERTDPVTGEKGCMVVGGTVEDFGWIEFFIVDGKMQAGSGSNYFHLEDQNVTDTGIEIVITSDDGTTTREVGVTGRIVNRPWYEAALNQLGFEQ